MLSRRLPLVPPLRRTLLCSPRSPRLSNPSRPLSTTEQRSSSDGGDHGSHYDPPGGWLWGIRPGEKYEKEGWENLFFYGFYGSIGLAVVAYAFKPDTSCVFPFSHVRPLAETTQSWFLLAFEVDAWDAMRDKWD
jgi:ESSS subunit of NADH:ubiquinone oxidoreductase (complex I)